MLYNYEINKNGLQDTKYFKNLPIPVLLLIIKKGPDPGLLN